MFDTLKYCKQIKIHPVVVLLGGLAYVTSSLAQLATVALGLLVR